MQAAVSCDTLKSLNGESNNALAEDTKDATESGEVTETSQIDETSSAKEEAYSDNESFEQTQSSVSSEEKASNVTEEKVNTEELSEPKSSGSADETEEETEEYVSPYLAPDFTVYDIEGNEVKLSDYRGRPIVLNFWARDCIYCTREMPDFEAAYKKYGDRVVFLMVCFTGFSGKGIDYEQEYITDNGYTFPVYFDTKNSAVSKYGINSIPQTFFINSDFDLYTYIPGMASAESLETCIGYILE